jgi:hypothetical protein
VINREDEVLAIRERSVDDEEERGRRMVRSRRIRAEDGSEKKDWTSWSRLKTVKGASKSQG